MPRLELESSTLTANMLPNVSVRFHMHSVKTMYIWDVYSQLVQSLVYAFKEKKTFSGSLFSSLPKQRATCL